MKKAYSILIFVFLTNMCYSQFVIRNTQYLGSSSTLVIARGQLAADSGFLIRTQGSYIATLDSTIILDIFLGDTSYAGGLQWRRFYNNAPYTDLGYTEIGLTAFGAHAGWAGRNLPTPAANTFIGADAGKYVTLTGNVGVGQGAMRNNVSGFRQVALGLNTLRFTTGGSENTAIGTFAMEVQRGASFNTAVGSQSLRGTKMGTGLVAVGVSALLRNTTSVASITITNGGSGCSSPPTVTISAPDSQTPGTISTNATGTAVLTGDAVTSVTITNAGSGYSTESGTPTVTFTGGGCAVPATGTVVLTSGDNNTAVGSTSLGGITYGKRNTAVGYISGLGTGNETSIIDNDVLFLGYNATRHTSIATTTSLSHATAIGSGAKVARDSSMILGDSAARIHLGIGTTAPHQSAQFEMQSTTMGFLPPRQNTTQQNAITSPATGLMLYNTDTTDFVRFDGTAWRRVGNRGYNLYTALLDQSGTSNPTSTVLQNSIGSISWARTGAGTYTGTLSGAFTASKTAVFITQGDGSVVGQNRSWRWTHTSTNVITVFLQNSDGSLSDEFAQTSIEVRVYP